MGGGSVTVHMVWDNKMYFQSTHYINHIATVIQYTLMLCTPIQLIV